MFKEFFSLIKESIIEHIKHRLFVVTVLFLVLFGILIYRLFDLQIVNGKKYQESFTYKSVKTVAVKATRGNIYDCNGKLLAYNEASYTLSYISGTDLTEAAAAKETTSNELRNDIVYKTILILEQNGDKMSVSLPLKLTSKGFEFTVSGNTLNTFLMNVYGASSVDSLTEEQAASTADVTLSDLSQLSGIGKSSMLRFTYTLLQEDFLSYNPETRKYSVGLEMYRIGLSKFNSLDVTKFARRHLQKLADEMGMICYIGIRQGDMLAMG